MNELNSLLKCLFFENLVELCLSYLMKTKLKNSCLIQHFIGKENYLRFEAKKVLNMLAACSSIKTTSGCCFVKVLSTTLDNIVITD